ncbi:hypothetical protein [Dactylosporangium sp. CA-092794]
MLCGLPFTGAPGVPLGAAAVLAVAVGIRPAAALSLAAALGCWR